MFEIPFVSDDIRSYCQTERAQKTSARITRLKEIADQLVQARWSVEWTITGLALRAPHGATAAEVRKKLDTLGIPEELRPRCSRSLLEVLTAQVEYGDRAWYAEADHDLRKPMPDWPEFYREDAEHRLEILERMPEIEERYGRKDLLVESSYIRGLLTGRQQALRWLFGEDWPELEDLDQEAADELEADDRAYYREETIRDRALDGMEELLFGRPKKQGTKGDPTTDVNQKRATTTVPTHAAPLTTDTGTRAADGVVTNDSSPCVLS